MAQEITDGCPSSGLGEIGWEVLAPRASGSAVDAGLRPAPIYPQQAGASDEWKQYRRVLSSRKDARACSGSGVRSSGGFYYLTPPRPSRTAPQQCKNSDVPLSGAFDGDSPGCRKRFIRLNLELFWLFSQSVANDLHSYSQNVM